MEANYAYTLPYRITEDDRGRQAEFITQKSSFTMKNNEMYGVIRDMLQALERDAALSWISEAYKEQLSPSKLKDILAFLSKQELVFLSEQPIDESERNLLIFLSQYTSNLRLYAEKMRAVTFCIYAGGNHTHKLAGLLAELGLIYRYVELDELEKLQAFDFVLVSVDSTQLSILDEIHERLYGRAPSLWSFVLFYSDSFMISPILNQQNHIDYSCLKNQLKLPAGQHGISRNVLLENMGINELLLEAIISLTKLNIKTSYGKAIIFNASDRTLDVEKVYYMPRYNFKQKAVYLKRWDAER
ncbi:hypothetical protein [Paenibacillus paeoniae]|uniref:Uncharacterized protein n=1 Tax=Paenibacillus paeoniae TaxID=2292705 RepID=A0A371PE72_9BACL|nr:hypothetical protein [Paenibacillus paeoniae]REK74243.1 hypothetical protein DX130_17010 [Paenibacillus paeoniae]